MRLLCLLLLLAGALPLRAQDSTLALPDLLASVRAEAPSLVAARLQAEVLRQRRDQVTALPDPMAMVMADPMRLFGSRRMIEARVEQEIPHPGKRRLRGLLADLDAERADLDADAFALDLELSAAEAFFDLYHAQARAALVREFRAELENFEQIAATRYEVGQGTQQAVLKAQLEKNALLQTLLMLEGDAEEARAMLTALRGRPMPETATLRPVSLAFPDTFDPDTALAARPEIQAFQRLRESAATAAALARLGYRPDVSVSLGVRTADEMMGGNALLLGVGVKLPIWRKAIRAGIAEAEAQARQVAAEQTAFETELAAELAEQLHHVHLLYESHALLETTLLPQAEALLESALSAYTTGQSDFLALLDAYRMRFDLRTERLETEIRLQKTTAALRRTLGLRIAE